jgi:hypothetical protein
MPLSIVCECGSRLEIDEAFAGKEITCPDCNRPLKLPTAKSDVPKRVSGLAIVSLTFALVGAFTVVGSLLGAALGWVARRRIRESDGQIGGEPLARAAIVLGGFFTLLTLGAMLSSEIFGLDALLREFHWADKLDYPAEMTVKITGKENDLVMNRPAPRWGVRKALTATGESDLVILVQPREDAYLAVQAVELDGGEQPEGLQARGLQRFYKSELVSMLGRLRGRALDKEGEVRESKRINNDTEEVTVDLRLGGIDRTFLLRITKAGAQNLVVLVGAARKNRFDRMQGDFRKAFDTFQVDRGQP